MKAIMGQTGCLIIAPETEIESYALKQWVIDNIDFPKSQLTEVGLKVTKGLIIQTGLPKNP